MASVHKMLQRTSRKGIRYAHAALLQSTLSQQHCQQMRIVGCKSYASHRNTDRIVSHSTILMQDGITIEELPILIRRANRDTYPFTSHTYSGENILKESEFDATFKQVLQDCANVNEVFKLLEVPADHVKGYCAAFALQRLHSLMYLNTDWNQIHSFIRTAVMKELYDTVERDISLLSNSMLVSLVECYLAASGFSPQCIDAINVEIECRLCDGIFTEKELVTLIRTLESGKLKLKEQNLDKKNDSDKKITKGMFNLTTTVEQFDNFAVKASVPEVRQKVVDKCESLLKTSWLHLQSRYHDIDQDSLSDTFQLITADNRNMVRLLEKPMAHHWNYLSDADVASILDSLMRLQVYSLSMMTDLGRWAYVHVHLMTPNLLVSYLNVFLSFSFMDKNLIHVMEKCITKNGNKIQTDILALCLEYLRSYSYVSPIVMDMAAKHFTDNWESYSPLELLAVLRTFGQLDYLPASPGAFLSKVESCLTKRFDLLEEAHVLEILGSFTFVDVLPRNFDAQISNKSFFLKIGALKSPQKAMALMWLKVLKHALHLEEHTDVNEIVKWIFGRKGNRSFFLFKDSNGVAISSLGRSLDDLFGTEFHYAMPYYNCTALYVDDRGVPLKTIFNNEIPQPDGVAAKKLVILLRNAHHYTTNTKQLLGAQKQRLSQLKKLGYTPIEIRANEFRCFDGASVLRQHLAAHIDFSNKRLQDIMEESVAQTQARMDRLQEKFMKDCLGYNEEVLSSDEFESDFYLFPLSENKQGIPKPFYTKPHSKSLNSSSIEIRDDDGP